MTEQERRERFTEELQALCQKYACVQVITSEDCVITLQDGSRVRGVRDSIGIALQPMDSPPEQAKTT